MKILNSLQLHFRFINSWLRFDQTLIKRKLLHFFIADSSSPMSDADIEAPAGERVDERTIEGTWGCVCRWSSRSPRGSSCHLGIRTRGIGERRWRPEATVRTLLGRRCQPGGSSPSIAKGSFTMLAPLCIHFTFSSCWSFEIWKSSWNTFGKGKYM